MVQTPVTAIIVPTRLVAASGGIRSSCLHASQYEELETGLADLPGVTAVRLQARTVMVVAGQVLYPIRYAKRDLPVTVARLRRAVGLRADLIRRHGPEPMQGELDLGLGELQEQEFHKDLGQLDPDVGVVLLAYACARVAGSCVLSGETLSCAAGAVTFFGTTMSRSNSLPRGDRPDAHSPSARMARICPVDAACNTGSS